MKKNYSIALIISSLFIGTLTFAQSGSTIVSVPVDAATFNQANEEVQNIDIKFCENDAKTKQYTFFAGQSQDICLEISNTAGKDILLSWDFVDGTLTNDQWKNRACLGGDAKESFGQYVSDIEKSFIIPARGSLVKHATLQYPETSRGSFHGCLVYYIQSMDNKGALDFNILVRKAKFIDIEIKEPLLKKYLGISVIIGVILCIVFVVGYILRNTLRKTKLFKFLYKIRRRESPKKRF